MVLAVKGLENCHERYFTHLLLVQLSPANTAYMTWM